MSRKPVWDMTDKEFRDYMRPLRAWLRRIEKERKDRRAK